MVKKHYKTIWNLSTNFFHVISFNLNQFDIVQVNKLLFSVQHLLVATRKSTSHPEAWKTSLNLILCELTDLQINPSLKIKYNKIVKVSLFLQQSLLTTEIFKPDGTFDCVAVSSFWQGSVWCQWGMLRLCLKYVNVYILYFFKVGNES